MTLRLLPAITPFAYTDTNGMIIAEINATNHVIYQHGSSHDPSQSSILHILTIPRRQTSLRRKFYCHDRSYIVLSKHRGACICNLHGLQTRLADRDNAGSRRILGILWSRRNPGSRGCGQDSTPFTRPVYCSHRSGCKQG
jgi:hypothetical protein